MRTNTILDDFQKLMPHGNYFSQKNGKTISYESSLERDFIETLEFDMNIRNYIHKPVVVEFSSEAGAKKFIPNFLLNFRNDLEGNLKVKPMLCSVKYRDRIKANWKIYKPEFSAAVRYADSQGWKFKIVTEKEIRNSYLLNVRFLLNYKYRSNDIDMDDYITIMKLLKDFVITSPEEIIKAASFDKRKQLNILYTLWFMVSNHLIACDLNRKLTMKSEIWYKE